MVVGARLALLLACIWLVACAAVTMPETEAGGDRATARALLAAAAREGSVPLWIVGAPAELRQDAILRALEDGVPGLEVHFAPAPSPPEGEHLRLLFTDREPTRPCATGLPETATAERLLLAWCGAGSAVAWVRVRPPERNPEGWERALWAAARALFPDRYPEEYGFDLLGPRVRIGVGVELGF